MRYEAPRPGKYHQKTRDFQLLTQSKDRRLQPPRVSTSNSPSRALTQLPPGNSHVGIQSLKRQKSAHNRSGEREEHQKIGEAELTISVGVLHEFLRGLKPLQRHSQTHPLRRNREIYSDPKLIWTQSALFLRARGSPAPQPLGSRTLFQRPFRALFAHPLFSRDGRQPCRRSARVNGERPPRLQSGQCPGANDPPRPDSGQ